MDNIPYMDTVVDAVEKGASLADVDTLTKGKLDIKTPKQGPEGVGVGDDLEADLSVSQDEDLDWEAFLNDETLDVPSDDDEAKWAEFLNEDSNTDAPDMSWEAYLDGDEEEVSEEVSKWDQFMYGFESMPSFTENAGIWLESRFPMGSIAVPDKDGGTDWYQSPEERYGEDFMDLDPESRRERIIEVRNKELAAEYGDVIEGDKQDTGAALVGKVFGTLADPTTVIPIGGGLKAAAVAGGTLGAADAAMYGLAQEGKIDPATVALGTVLGGVAAPVLTLAGRGASKAAGKVKDRSIQRARGASRAQVNAFQDELAVQVVKGKSAAEAYQDALIATGMTEKELVKHVAAGGVKPVLPSPAKARQIVDMKGSAGTRPQGAFSKGVDYYIGSLQTRIGNIAPKLASRVDRFEFDLSTKIHQAHEKVQPFLRKVSKLSPDDAALMNRNLMNGKYDIVEDMARTRWGDEGVEELNALRSVIDDFTAKLEAQGYPVVKDGYFPRMVNDREGMLKAMGRKKAQELNDKILKAKQAAARKGRDLTEVEESEIINRFLRTGPRGTATPSGMKSRRFNEVPEEFEKFYASPMDSMQTYIRRMTNELERRNFFGRLGVNVKASPATKGETADDFLSAINAERESVVSSSIGDAVRKLRDAGEVADDQLDELTALLEARFNYGTRSPSGWMQDTKNILYSTTLSNPVSAATQLEDLGLAMYLNGFRNTMSALFSKKNVNSLELGLHDIAEELASDVRTSSKVLNKLMKASGFESVDRLGKNVTLNGALRKFRKQANTEAGRKELGKRWKDVFEGEYAQVLDDLQAGRITPNVKYMLWNQLARTQPIALSQLPEAYVRNPNGRVLYMLKSFTLKQLDLIRRDIVQQAKRGNVKEAGQNAARLITLTSMAGLGAQEVKDLMLGRETDISDTVTFKLWGLLGVSSYLAGNVKEGKLSDAVKDTVAPPLRVIDDMAAGVASSIDAAYAGDMSEVDTDFVKHLPVGGKIIHNFFLGGLEDQQEWEEKRERQNSGGFF